MGRFYAGSASMVPSHAAPVQQGPRAPGSVVRALPARPFGPYMIRPEFIGAPVSKPIIPPYADQQTIASLAPPTSAVAFGHFGYTLPQAMAPVHGAVPVGPTGRVQPLFTSVSQQKAARATSAVQAANAAAAASQAADMAALTAGYQASAAQGHAAVNAHPIAQQMATRATRNANILANKARALATTAAQQSTRAQRAVSQAMTDSSITNSGYQNDPTDPGSVDPNLMADLQAQQQVLMQQPPTFPEATPPPGFFAQQPASGLSPLTAVAGAGAVGFLVGGPLGAIIGAVAGGGYAFMKNHSDQADAAAQTLQAQQIQAEANVMPSGGAAAMSFLRGYRRW